MNEMREGCAMALTILYRHRDRPDEAGMTMISSNEQIAVIVGKLEKRGFVVDRITARSPANAAATTNSS
jgi:hypothetical protein